MIKYRILFIVFFCCLLFYICFKNTGNDAKNMLGFRSYPDEVQKAVRKDSDLKKIAPEDKSVTSIMISNFILYTILFSFFGVVSKQYLAFNGFLDTFVFFLINGEILNAFDLLVIDLLWWRNTKRIRFSILPNKEAYQDPKKHIDSFLRGIVVFIFVALATSLIVGMV